MRTQKTDLEKHDNKVRKEYVGELLSAQGVIVPSIHDLAEEILESRSVEFAEWLAKNTYMGLDK